MLLLCPLAFGFFTFGKANVTEVIITQQNDLNGYVSEWNYTVDPSPVSDEANSVAVDHQRNIIVVGVNRSITVDTSWLIMKLAPDGSLLWTRNYDFSSGADSATGVVVDPDDNITVVGYDRNTNSTADYEWRILKLAPDGELLWTNSYNFSSSDDRPLSVAIDSQNNTIAVGYDKNTSSSSDFEWRVVKLASDGTLLWTDSYNFSPSYDVAEGVAVDPDNNITVVGSDSNVDRQWRIIKITPDGSNIFQNYPLNISPDPDEPSGVAIDHENNTIVVGYDRSRGYYTPQWLIIKYDAVGNQVWNCTVKNDLGVGTSSFPLSDVARGVAVDSSNNITVVGYLRTNDTAPGEVNNQWAIMKFGYDGSSLWNYTVNFSPFNDEAKAIAFDSYDDMIVAGFDSVSGIYNYQWRIMKFSSLSSNVHNIDTGLNYATIQAAIDADETVDGHTLLADAGTYYENIVVDKSLSIVGENRDTTTIDGLNTGDTISINADRVQLRNFTVTNCSGPIGGERPYAGIYLNNTDDSIVSGNNVTGNNYLGVYVSRGRNNSISSNLVMYNWFSGISTTNPYSSSESYSCSIVGNNMTSNYLGLEVGCGNNSIIGNTFNRDGLNYVSSSYNNVVSGNIVNGKPLVYLENRSHLTIDDAGQVVLVNCDDIRVENLNLSYTVTGLILYGTNNSMIVNNTMAANNYDGIKLRSCSGNIIEGNNVSSNTWNGFELVASDANTIIRNMVAANWIGIYIALGSNNSIYHNDFIANMNSTPFYSRGANTWDNGYPSGGNYWSDYTGKDSNGDGFGDTPYTMVSNNTDRYPLVSPYWYWSNPILCDVNRDMKVDMKDLASAASHLGSRVGVSGWNPYADVTGTTRFVPDGIVDIRDLVAIAKNFGKGNHYSPAPSLTLFTPTINGLTATINGVTWPGTSVASVTRIHWNWGDGYEEDHWFANAHTYSIAGVYTVTVTSYQSDGLATTRTTTVSLSTLARISGSLSARAPKTSPI